MYSFQPLPPPYTGHTGFWIVCCMFFAIYLVVLTTSEGVTPKVVWFIMSCGFVTIAYLSSFNQEYVYPKNEKVLGKFIGYVTEGYSERSGKSYVDRHYVYVMYEVPGGRVLLPAVTNAVYPPIAVLYKN